MKDLIEAILYCIVIVNILCTIYAVVVLENYDKANLCMQISIINYIALAWLDLGNKISNK